MKSVIDTKRLSKLLRARRGSMSLRAAAHQIGDVSTSTLSRLERGATPNLDTFLNLTWWLGVPASELLKRN